MSTLTDKPRPAVPVLVVLAGSKALGLAIRQTLRVLAVRDLGPDYSHQVAVSFRLRDGRPRTLYARHRNRLADPAGCNLNDGNPARKVRVAFRNLQALPEQQAE
jgi:hypothetical protein